MSPRSRTLVVTLAGLVGAILACRAAWRTVSDLVWRPLPWRDPKALVAIYPANPFIGASAGIPPRKFHGWREKATLIEGVEAYRWRTFWLGGEENPEQIPGAQVTAGLFDLLGVAPAWGRTFTAADERPGAAPVAVVDYDLGMRLAGRTADLDGTPHQVVGVMPRDFWFVSRQRRIWTPLALDRTANRPVVFVIGRLKPGVGTAQAGQELRAVAFRTGPYRATDPVRAVRLGEFLGRSIRPALYLPAAFFALALFVAAVQAARAPAGQRRAGLRYWAFFAAKSLAGLTVISALWVLFADSTREAGLGRWYSETSGWLGAWLFVVGCCGFLYLAWRDQRARCRICLRRLRVPFHTGRWSSLLLDRPATEYLCPAGCGTLSVAGSALAGGQADEWTDMDDAWRGFFAGRN